MLINAGQANAATGDAGYQDTVKSAQAVADALGIDSDQVLIESTGLGYACAPAMICTVMGRSKSGAERNLRSLLVLQLSW